MEIKTLEHYAISRIQELENELEKLNEMYKLQSKISDELRKKLEYVGTFFRIRKAYNWDCENKNTYIDFSSVWKKHNPDNYKKLCEMFDLV